MKEYKIEEIVSSATNCETLLNELAAEGWKIVGLTDYWMFLEREVTASEKQQIHG